jgi:hypothetical protein
VVVDGFYDSAVDAIVCGSDGAECRVPKGMLTAVNARKDCEDCAAFVVTNGKTISVVKAADDRAIKRYAVPKDDDWAKIGVWIARDFKQGSGSLAEVEGDEAPEKPAVAAGAGAAPGPAVRPTNGLTKEDVAQIVQNAVESAALKKEREDQERRPKPAAKAPVSDVDTPLYQEEERPDDYAVVVGIEKYPDLPAAQYAERDAQAMRDHLVALGYPPRNVILLTGARASRASLAKNLDSWLPNHVTKDSTVFFYYSGHGAPEAGSGLAYLMPVDGDPQYLKDTAYPVKMVYQKLGALKAKRVIVALDSCFSGAGGRSVLAAGTRPLVTKVDTGMAAGRIVSLSASGSDEISGMAAAQGHGLFTYYMLKGLNGAAADAAGRVTVRALYDYLSPLVQDAARRDNRSQTPQLQPARVDDLVLR